MRSLCAKNSKEYIVPINELAEGIFRILGRFIGHLIVNFLVEIVFYLIGKVVLRIITFGKYPPPPEQSHSAEFVQMVGFLVLVAAFAVLFIVKN
jgi:hypothetical protein